MNPRHNQVKVYCPNCNWITYRTYKDEDRLFGDCIKCNIKMKRFPLIGMRQDLKLKKVWQEMHRRQNAT